MKKPLVLVASALIPLCLFFAVWQSFCAWQVRQDLDKLERAQQSQLEANKRLVSLYASESSPARIAERAEKELGMKWPDQSQVLRLVIPGSQTPKPAAPTSTPGASP